MTYGHAERNLALLRQLKAETRQLLERLDQPDPEQPSTLTTFPSTSLTSTGTHGGGPRCLKFRFSVPGNVKSGRLCRCGHIYAAHEHYRPGLECSLCADCARYRSVSGLGALVAGQFTRRQAAKRQLRARRDRRLGKDLKPNGPG